MALISLFSEADFRKIVPTKFGDPKATLKFDNSLEGHAEIINSYSTSIYGLLQQRI